jgi:hypothetical protein
MPRDASLILSDRGPTLAIVCESCARRGRHTAERLTIENGDAKLTELLVALAHCTRPASTIDARRYRGSSDANLIGHQTAGIDPLPTLRISAVGAVSGDNPP